ncbi:MAG: GC-type dockerin domain-anchored protein [Phycisphaerales bacterium]
MRIGALLAFVGASAPALAQSSQRAAFVANNGNLEGSVSAFTFNPDGSPRFVAKYVTGSTPSTSMPVPGTNAYGIGLSPDGLHLATSHATASTTVEQVSVFRVNAGATLTPAGVFTTPDSPLDCEWIANDVLVCTRTRTSGGNEIVVYRYTESPASLVEIDREPAGAFCAYVTVNPARTLIYATDSNGFLLHGFRINANGTLDSVGSFATGGVYPLQPGFTRDGQRLYAGGGISSGGNKIPAFAVDAGTGALASLLNAPFVSPGSSPKLAVSSADDRFVFVGHGTDATCRSFAVDAGSGGLTPTGFLFDVGIQGSLGDAAVLGNLLLITDNFDGPTGLYSFTIQSNGSFTINGGLVSTQGTAARAIAAWEPPTPECYANCDGSTAMPILNVNDFVCFSNRFAAGESAANCDGSTTPPVLNVNDFVCFSNAFAAGCS